MAGIKAPVVWRDMDQAALDAAYDQNVYAPNRLQLLDRYSCNSETTRSVLGAPQRFGYGEAEIEGLDIYRSSRPERTHTDIYPWWCMAVRYGGPVRLSG